MILGGTYSVVLPAGGFAGWTYLNRTMEAQKTAFAGQPTVARDVAHFRDQIATARTAADLVADRRLLTVALGAFGLQDDIGNRHFIETVLDEGTLDEKALANRLSDKSYLELSSAFGFGDFATPRTVLSGFPDEITAAYLERQFEVAVGEADPGLRLALNAQRALPELAAEDASADTKWFRVLGSAPLRSLFETAFGLPSDSFGGLDLDQQLAVMKDRAGPVLGSDDLAVLADPERLDRLIRTYLARAEIAGTATATSGASAALTLLGSGGSAGTILGLLYA
ncbi:DUF1217 domain-containing protein [Frigidibacter oleivorans]|uniref:DUF1217 domain-containing protein n=1 Tax=Frigidibacter oleivorans TaxID=2487129 RepID=UPI000F8ED6F2|nr:DUF1217 domain-containing protein [Frigidibacter oleivorans]